jgi:hypothetical protein
MLGTATTAEIDARAGQQLMVPVFFTQAHKIINELLQFCERSGTLASTGGPLAPSNDSDLFRFICPRYVRVSDSCRRQQCGFRSLVAES